MSILEALIFAIVFMSIRFFLDKNYSKPETKWMIVREIFMLALFAFVVINLIEAVIWTIMKKQFKYYYGEPLIDFLDDKGNVTYSLPPK